MKENPEVGRIDYSPDYKSEGTEGTAASFGPRVVMRSKTKGVLVGAKETNTAERVRLEREVIEAARDAAHAGDAWEKDYSDEAEDRVFKCLGALAGVVANLEQFESSQEKKG